MIFKKSNLKHSLALFLASFIVLLLFLAQNDEKVEVLRPEPPKATEIVQNAHLPTITDSVIPTSVPQEAPIQYIEVNTPGLNLREGPGIEYERITTLVSGDIAQVITGGIGHWLKVRYVDVEGWLDQRWTLPIDGELELAYTQKDARELYAQYFDHEINCNNADPYDGHIYQNACIPAVIDRAAWMLPYPPHTTGQAGRYYEGIMEIVLKNRNLSTNGYKGAVALESCAHIGDSVWLKFGAGWEGPYLVADCGNRYGLFRIVAWLGMIVEVDAQTFERVYDAGQWTGHAEVCFSNPCAGPAVSWSNYWLERITYLEK